MSLENKVQIIDQTMTINSLRNRSPVHRVLGAQLYECERLQTLYLLLRTSSDLDHCIWIKAQRECECGDYGTGSVHQAGSAGRGLVN